MNETHTLQTFGMKSHFLRILQSTLGSRLHTCMAAPLLLCCVLTPRRAVINVFRNECTPEHAGEVRAAVVFGIVYTMWTNMSPVMRGCEQLARSL